MATLTKKGNNRSRYPFSTFSMESKC